MLFFPAIPQVKKNAPIKQGALFCSFFSTLGVQRAIRLPAAKINAGGVIVLGGRQPTRVLFLASAGFLSLAGPS